MGSYLYSPPSYLSGFARLLDFGNTYDHYNRVASVHQADGLGLLWDWAAVASDMRNSVSIFEAKHASELRHPSAAEAEFSNR